MSKLLTISAIRDNFSRKKCRNKNCMEDLCRMPTDCVIGSTNNETCSSLEYFTNLVTEARSHLDSTATSKERIKYWMRFFENKHHYSGNVYQAWTYQICTTLCPPITSSAVYGVDCATIDSCQRIIRQGHTVESKNEVVDNSTAVDAMKYFGLDLKSQPASSLICSLN